MLALLLAATIATAPPPPAPARGVVDAAVLVPYRVQHGDTLWSIAERFYGDGRCWRLVLRDTIHTVRPRRLHAGELLRVRLRG